MRSLIALVFALGLAVSAHAVAITSFGSTADSDGGWTWTPQSSSITGTEAAGAVLFANNSLNLNLTGATGITLTATVTSAPANGFSFILEDVTGKLATTGFSWTDFIGGASVTHSFTAVDAGFNFGAVTNWNLLSGASGSTINVILSAAASASPVPEPSTYVAIFGAAALGFVVVRRRFASK